MKLARLLPAAATATAVAIIAACTCNCGSDDQRPSLRGGNRAQVPDWSQGDLDFFLHGSMSTEIVPISVLNAFERTYPQLFPSSDFSHLGAIPDRDFGWPVGFSRAAPPHLGGLPSIGINCAACHVAEIQPPAGGAPVRVLGVTANFNAEGFFASIVGATYLTRDPDNMKHFLLAYLEVTHPMKISQAPDFNAAWNAQSTAILGALNAEPAGAKNVGPAGLYKIAPADLQFSDYDIASADLPRLAANMLKLFHNMRTALHLPDAPPATLPPPSGPGRNDAFGLLAVGLFNDVEPFAPVKFGVVWNVSQRHWVHWDGNTRLPIARNLLAAVGLGAPLIDHHAQVDFAALQRHTSLTEQIKPAHYPWSVDQSAAARGSALYQSNCASCHSGAETDARLYSPKDVGTDPVRAQLFTQPQADKFNKFLAELQTPGYVPLRSDEPPGLRSTQKYLAPVLAGVWARSPYLHNGSVRTMDDLLTPPADRPATFKRGSNIYDEAAMGYKDEGTFTFDSKVPANSNQGHDYGSTLTPPQKKDLVEFLKTL